MGTTQPIRNADDLKEFTDYYLHVQPSARNYALVIISLNTALRISDLLSLKWKDLYDFETNRTFSHLRVIEQKTNKPTMIALNSHVKSAIKQYKKQRMPKPEDYVFSKSTSPDSPIARSTAYRAIKKAVNNTIKLPDISCHSLRKTFGYNAWKNGVPPAMLMSIYNHSSYANTKRYLGIDQDERDEVFLKNVL